MSIVWKLAAFSGALIAGLLAQVTSPVRKPFQPKAPPEQPVAFSHKTHSATGAKCVDCHAMRAQGIGQAIPRKALAWDVILRLRKTAPRYRSWLDSHNKKSRFRGLRSINCRGQ